MKNSVKKLLFSICLTLCVLTPLKGQSQSVKFFEGTLYEALSAARSQGKILLAEFYADWNYKSRWMHNILETTEGIDRNFMLYSINTGSKEGAGLAVQYSVTDYPMIIVFNTNSDAIAKIDRTLDQENLKAQLLTLTFSNNRYMVQRLNQIYTIASSNNLATPAQLDSLVNNYINLQSKEYLTMPQHWELFSTASTSYYGSTAYKYLVENYKDFFDATKANEQIENICYNTILPYVIGSKPLSDSLELFTEMLNDSLTLEAVPMLEDLVELARLRVEGSESKLIEKVEYVANRMDEEYEYQLVMALDFVVNRLDYIERSDKTKARRMLENLKQKVNSYAKIQLIDMLLIKFS